ncbi:hypothetical protein B0H17DRAFT_853493, partial [Mycena rosella]
MKHSNRLAVYIVEFDRLAVLTQWGDNALRHQFYEGLPRCIKDNMVHHNYPNTLLGVKIVARRIDACYWKRETEKQREREREKASGSSSGAQAGTSGATSATSSQKSTGNAKPSGNSKPATGSPAAKATPKPYADKLDSSGKLKQEERDRRTR